MRPVNFNLNDQGKCSNNTLLIAEYEGEQSGSSVGQIGDLNGDGKPELLIGAQYYNNSQGATYVVSGASINLATGGNISLIPGENIVQFVGLFQDTLLGTSVSSIGDLNGDGKPELLIGAYDYSSGEGSNQGATYVVSGASINLATGGSVPLTPGENIVQFVGQSSYDQSGIAVSSIGDLNGDGKPELLIGAYGYPNGSGYGATYVVSGASINLTTGGSVSLTPGENIVQFVAQGSYDQSGIAVSSIGDLNGDGKPELLIGAQGYPNGYGDGATYVVSGASINLTIGGSVPLTPGENIVQFLGQDMGFSGSSVNSIGDLNGDGKPELLIGAPSYPGANGYYTGATYVVSGASINLATGGIVPLTPGENIVEFVGQNIYENSGFSVNSIGDLNGDGKPELLIGVPSYSGANGDYNTGATYVISGASINLTTGGSVPLIPGENIILFVGQNSYDSFGISVRSIGDLNGDGKPNLLIGVPGYPSFGGQGATYVVSGNSIFGCSSPSASPEEVSTNLKEMFPINEEQQDIPEKVHLHLRGDDNSLSLKTEPVWMGLPLNAAQIPLIQTSIHLLKQSYNKIVDWFQGKGNDKHIITTLELLSHEQVAEALNGYNNVSQKLEHIISFLELDSAIDKTLVSWYKESLLKHKEKLQQLLDKKVINQELLTNFCENIKTFANDLNEFAQQQVSDDLALSYIKAELTKTNQALANLPQSQLDTAKNTEMLNDLPAQMQADNTQHILYEDVTNLSTNNISDYLVDSSLLIGEVPLLLG